MASTETEPRSGEDTPLPPPRPTTPPLRRGFVWVLLLLSLVTTLVYGVPYMLEQSGYAYETGRARAATEALAGLDAGGALARASELFRLATHAVAPAVVHIQTQTFAKGGVAGRSLGSGVVIDKDRGFIVTNHHVIRDADVITVRVGRRTEMIGELVGDDPKTDLAVIRVKGTLPVAAVWGDSDRLEEGEWVLAIGSPFGLERTVSAGIISATARSNLPVEVRDAYEDYLQTDVAINPGNSGGPLVDLRGRIVGINTAIVFSSTETGGGNQGIGFAISASLARRVVDQLIASGKVVRGYLGVVAQPMTPDQARLLKVPEQGGALVGLVLPGSPAEKAGIKADDVLLAVAGKPTADPSSLRNTTFTLAAGSKVPVAFLRGGARREVEVAIVAMPVPSVAYFGFDVKDADPPDATGAIVVDRVVPGGPADKAALKSGTRIFSIGRRRIFSKAEFDAAIAQIGGFGGIPLGVARGDKIEPIMVGAP